VRSYYEAAVAQDVAQDVGVTSWVGYVGEAEDDAVDYIDPCEAACEDREDEAEVASRTARPRPDPNYFGRQDLDTLFRTGAASSVSPSVSGYRTIPGRPLFQAGGCRRGL